MLDAVLIGVLAFFGLAGSAMAAFGLPGTWLILVAATAYDWRYDWTRIGPRWLIALAVVAVAAELVDTFASVAAARRAGASRRASVGALIGGLAGVILLSVPVPLIGAIIGGLLGCFAGAALAECTVRDDLAAGTRVGVFATLGRLAGLLTKLAAAVVMAGAAVSLAVFD